MMRDLLAADPISGKVRQIDIDEHLHEGVIVEVRDVRGAADGGIELRAQLGRGPLPKKDLQQQQHTRPHVQSTAQAVQSVDAPERRSHWALGGRAAGPPRYAAG